MENTLIARAEKAEFLELITLLELAITISGYVDKAKEQFFYEKSFQKSMNGQDKGKWIQTAREEDEGQVQVQPWMLHSWVFKARMDGSLSNLEGAPAQPLQDGLE